MSICPQCKKELPDTALICPDCAAQLSTASTAPAKDTAAARPAKKPLSDKAHKILVICLAAVLLLCLILPSVLSAVGGDEFILFLKDEQVYLLNVATCKTTALFDGAASGGLLGPDGKTLFYTVSEDASRSVATVYARDLSSQSAVKIGSGIVDFTVSNDGGIVTCITGDCCTRHSNLGIFQHDLKKSYPIAEDGISQYKISSDGKTVLYLTDSHEFYVKKFGKEAEKIDESVASHFQIDDDFETAVYKNGNVLYKCKAGGKPEVISTDVYSLLQIYEDGTVYYTKQPEGVQSTGFSLADYFIDDLLESDKNIKEPVFPECPDRYDYATADEYSAAMEVYREAMTVYQEESRIYQDKLKRDEVRERLKTIGNDTAESYELIPIYYFDGKKETLVAKSSGMPSQISSKYPFLVFSAKSGKSSHVVNRDKLLMSEFKDPSEIYNKISLILREMQFLSDLNGESDASPTEKYVAYGKDVYELGLSKITDAAFSKDGKTLFLVDGSTKLGSSHGVGPLYSLPTRQTGTYSPPALLDTDVKSYDLFTTDDNCVYFKNVQSDAGDLYVDGKKVKSDVYTNACKYAEKSDALFFLTDWDKEQKCGTLMMYQNGSVRTIAENVYTYVTTDRGSVVLLTDYEGEKKQGMLKVYSGGRLITVTSGVSAITSIPQQ